jgi:hypothetical protein
MQPVTPMPAQSPVPPPAPARLAWEEPSPRKSPRGHRPRGRWLWTASGVLVVTAVAVPLAALIFNAGKGGGTWIKMRPTTHILTISQPVSSVNVQSYGSQVRVIAGPVKHVQVVELVQYDPQQGDPPAVTDAVSGGQLTLAAPSCATSGCSVGFVLTVPSSVSVTAQTQGGDIIVTGAAGANLDSGGGQVVAMNVSGPLTVSSEGGPQRLVNVDGPVKSESGSGQVIAQGITGATATITTDGGPLVVRGMSVPSVTASTGGGDAQLGFTTTPSTADVTTNGGAALLQVPGGPYALTADSDGGPENIGIATDPAAHRALTVISGGGQLIVEPSSGRGRASVTIYPGQGPIPRVPPVPPVPQSSP